MVTRLRHKPVPPETEASPPSRDPLRPDPPSALCESAEPIAATGSELPPLPRPADGLAALVNLLAESERRGGRSAAAVPSLLAGLHRSFALLTPGYPTAAAPPGLWGFSPAPAASLDELDAQLNRLEDVLLQLLPPPAEEWTQE